MPGLEAALGANPYLFLVATRIERREFDSRNAMSLIRFSDLSRMTTGAHPGPHVVVTATNRDPDFHLKDTKFGTRSFHTMFRSELHAATAVAKALNTAAGEEMVLRLRHLRFGSRAVLYSRSGADPDSGVVRSSGNHGVSWKQAPTQFVTLVLEHRDGQLVLITAYPNLESTGQRRVVPPVRSDLLEMPSGQFAIFW